MPRTSTFAAMTAATTMVLTGCGDVLPGFYTEGAEDDALVEDCVDYVQMAAFTGEAGASEVWDSVGQDESSLRDLCSGLLETDRSTLERYAQDKRVFVREMNAADSEDPVTDRLIVDDSRGAHCNANYSGLCLPLVDDVDCRTETGSQGAADATTDGPWFIDRAVFVRGDDVFDLDGDGDGIGCEPNADFSA
jgi:hypothetical protein